MKKKVIWPIILCCAMIFTSCAPAASNNKKLPTLEWQKETVDDKDCYVNNLELEKEWANYGIGDPYIMKYNGVYYLYVSTPYGTKGIKVWSSKNAFDWKYCGIVAADQDCTFTAYSPKVIYSNGVFYLYTTPDGKGLHVLTGPTPTGPFKDATGKIHSCIDACIFIDDDGTWYLGHGHSFQGIEYHVMDSPTRVGQKTYHPGTIVEGNGGNNWTETGEIFKRDNTYFMTYSGNHVANDSYRTNWASSNKVLSDYKLGELPLLTSTQGKLKGTGCGLVFTGADLMSDYIVYHNLVNPNVGPIRHMNIDIVTYNGAEMSACGPTAFKQQKGQMPTYYDFIDKADNFTGMGAVKDGFGSAAAGSACEYNREIGKNFVAEMNYNACGGEAKLSAASGTVQITVDAKGNMTLKTPNYSGTVAVRDYKSDALHNIKIDFRNDRLQVFIDGMRKFDVSESSAGGKLSYSFSKEGKVGFTAATEEEKAQLTADKFLPYTGKFFAKDYAGEYSALANSALVDNENGGKAVHMSAADYLRYRINAGENTLFNVAVRYRASGDGEMAFVSKSGEVEGSMKFTNTDGEYIDGVIENVTTEQFQDIVTLVMLSGEADVSSFRFYPVSKIDGEIPVSAIDDKGFTVIDGKWSAIGGNVKSYEVKGKEQAHAICGDTRWADYEVSVDIKLDSKSMGKAGVLVRAANCAANTGSKHQIFAYNDQSYYIYLDDNGNIGIKKHNYNSVDVMEKQRVIADPFDTVALSVTVRGNTITVKANGEEVLSYVDTSCPYLTGRVALHSETCTATYSNFKVIGV